MTTRNKKIIIALVALVMFFCFYKLYNIDVSKTPVEQPQALEPLVSLTIQNSNNIANHFMVKVASSRKQKIMGLMYRLEMDKEKGMLFPLSEGGEEVPVSMWMKNTYIPLDMIFIGKSGDIVKIARDTVPKSLDIIPSDFPVWAVLELNAGVTEDLNIRKGDKVIHPIFGRP